MGSSLVVSFLGNQSVDDDNGDGDREGIKDATSLSSAEGLAMASMRVYTSWRRRWEGTAERRDTQRPARHLVALGATRRRAHREWHLLARRHRLHCHITNSTTSLHSENTSDSAEDDSGATQEDKSEAAGVQGEEKPSPSLWTRIKGWFRMDKDRLQSLGMGAFLAYGFVSNVNYGVFFTIAWLSHVKRTGMIPFARGQWKAFLGVYAGLWAIQNFLRPVRIAAAIALTPLVNQMLKYLVENLGIERRQAFLLLIFGLAVFTFSSLVTGIWILGGIPKPM